MIAEIKSFASTNRHLLTISVLYFLLIYAATFTSGYGYFIDEFYYIACANHPALGYVDHPPLAPLILTVFQALFGNSLYAIRFLMAFNGAILVVLCGHLAREIGGGRVAQIISALVVACSPVYAIGSSFFSMGMFEQLLAVLILIFTIRMVKDGKEKYWLIIGALAGLGLLNKHTFGVFLVGLVISLAISGHWKLVANRWFVWGILLGAALLSPNMIWQVLNGFPSLEFYRNITLDKNVQTPPLMFLLAQVEAWMPFIFLIAFVGAFYLLFAKDLKPFRFLGLLFLGVFFFFMFAKTSRPDRMAFVYPATCIAGALLIERVSLKPRLGWVKGLVAALMILAQLAALPLVLPYLHPSSAAQYLNVFGFNTELERGKKPQLFQFLSDRIGWEEKVAMVAKAYSRLDPKEKASTLVAASNYGQAGAIELLGASDGLPPVVCGHNNYYLWSKERLKGDIMVRLIPKMYEDRLKEVFETVEDTGLEFSNPYVSNHEDELRVFICRRPKMPLPQLLERMRFFY